MRSASTRRRSRRHCGSGSPLASTGMWITGRRPRPPPPPARSPDSAARYPTGWPPTGAAVRAARPLAAVPRSREKSEPPPEPDPVPPAVAPSLGGARAADLARGAGSAAALARRPRAPPAGAGSGSGAAASRAAAWWTWRPTLRAAYRAHEGGRHEARDEHVELIRTRAGGLARRAMRANGAAGRPRWAHRRRRHGDGGRRPSHEPPSTTGSRPSPTRPSSSPTSAPRGDAGPGERPAAVLPLRPEGRARRHRGVAGGGGCGPGGLPRGHHGAGRPPRGPHADQLDGRLRPGRPEHRRSLPRRRGGRCEGRH
jgi:hypothetical protein